MSLPVPPWELCSSPRVLHSLCPWVVMADEKPVHKHTPAPLTFQWAKRFLQLRDTPYIAQLATFQVSSLSGLYPLPVSFHTQIKNKCPRISLAMSGTHLGLAKSVSSVPSPLCPTQPSGEFQTQACPGSRFSLQHLINYNRVYSLCHPSNCTLYYKDSHGDFCL